MKIYRDNIKMHDAKLLKLSKILNRISFLRLFIFVISSAILITLVSIKLFTPFFIVFPISIIFFAIVLKHHTKIAYLRKHTSFLKRINEFEILREKCNLEEFDTGHKFINQNHPYTSDLDAYIFYKNDDNVTYNNAIGNERRASMGICYFGRYKSITFNNEAVYQFGSIENQNIRAWTLSMQVENSTKLGNHFYNLGFKSEIISGDKNINDNTLNTFDALYPRGAYFGRIARFGPSNLIDIHPYINTQYKKLFAEVDYNVFWRYSVNDGVYNAALLLEYPNTNNQRFMGQQIGTIIGYEINNHINLEFESNIIFPGAFLKQSNQGDTLFHFVFTTEIKF